MNIRKNLIFFSIAAVLSACGSDQKAVAPWPGTAAWAPVTNDPTIAINRVDRATGTGYVRPEYDVATATLTLDRSFDAAIAWKDSDCLMILLWNPLTSGGALIRIRSVSKEVVYCALLVGLGPIDHSQYHNSLQVFTDRELIMVAGDEGAGHYREIRRISDGSLVNVSQEYSKTFVQETLLRVK